jgi:hypothetical protein
MPTWGKVAYELNKKVNALQRAGVPPDPLAPSPHDEIRRKYLHELSAHTGHPVIVYASGWMEGRPSDPGHVNVDTRDIMGFMEAVNGLPKGPLDLMLHSPGGDANAAEQIMNYLRSEGFGPIRAIVPIAAMSAATMMALCCDEILMGRHSQLGPIDPQFTIITPDGPRSSPAQAILDQFENAKAECGSNQSALAAWLPILRAYGPGLLSQCLSAQGAAEDMVSVAMAKYMFADTGGESAKAKEIAAWFNNHKMHRSHGKPLRIEEVQEKGVKVCALEDESELQDRVLTAWHGVQLSLSQVAVNKIVESSMADGKSGCWIISGSPGVQLLVNPRPPAAPAPNPAQPPSGTSGGNRAARRAGNKGKR